MSTLNEWHLLKPWQNLGHGQALGLWAFDTQGFFKRRYNFFEHNTANKSSCSSQGGNSMRTIGPHYNSFR